MKKMFLPLFLSILVIANNGFGQTKKPTAKISQVNSGRAIQITLTPYKNTKIYIGTNYGKNKVLADSCILN